MRPLLRANWKAIGAIALLLLLALASVNPGAAVPELPLATRLRAHVTAVAAKAHGTATPAEREQAARYIENVLKAEGYAIRRQAYRAGGRTVRNIEVSVANVAPKTKPARIFIVGANASDKGSGTAAVLELARLLKDMRPSQGTEVKFVFFANEEPPRHEGEELGSMQQAHRLPDDGPDEGAPVLEAVGWYSLQSHSHEPDAARQNAGPPDAGSFIAFVGTLESSREVQDALSAFRAISDFPAHGLAAPAYVQGVTLSDHSSYHRFGYPAIMITDTAFMRYPYYHTGEGTPDKFDYDGTARVVQGLARTLVALAAGAQG